MHLAKMMGAAALAITAMQAVPASAQGMDMKISASNPVVAIGVTENEQAMPDMATVTVGVSTKLPDSKKALDETNKIMAKIMAVVKTASIAAKDVQTSGVSVAENTNYSDNGPVQDGYRAMSTATVTVRDLTKLKTLISDVVVAGANQLEGPYFSIDNEDALTDKARMKAFDTAKRRAMAYAAKAGFKSVRLLKVNEDAGYEGVEYAAAAAGDAAALKFEKPPEEAIASTPVEPGLISRSVAATFHFEMVP